MQNLLQALEYLCPFPFPKIYTQALHDGNTKLKNLFMHSNICLEMRVVKKVSPNFIVIAIVKTGITFWFLCI